MLDASTGLAGPLAAMILGDAGADVIRVETPSRPEVVAADDALPGAAMWNRNKRILRSELDDSRVQALLADTDVVITTSSADSQALRCTGDGTSANARTVHLCMPDLVPQVDAHTADALAAAAWGVARRQSSYDGGPVESVFPLVSYVRGAWGAACAVAALVEREQSRRGQTVTVDSLHGVLVSAGPQIVVELDRPAPATAVGATGPNPTYAPYLCADGRWLFLGALSAKFQDAALEVLGRGGILRDSRIDDVRERMFAPENRQWIRELLAESFRERTRDEWLDALAGVDCPAGAVEPPGLWLEHPQVDALRQRREVDDPRCGPVAMPWLPVYLDGTPIRDPAPRTYVEAATWQQSSEDGGAAPAVEGPASTTRGPLSGIRVLNLGTVLAGPFAGSLLAELGADVVKVESLSGDPFGLRGHQNNRGLRSLSIDLRSPAGHDTLMTLVQDADVVLDNFRPGVLQRLRVDRPSLAVANPAIICASITGFGSDGPLGGRPGYDPILQAMSGMMSRQGGPYVPAFITVAVNDVAAATFTVLGTVLALYSRAHDGQGQQVMTPLAATACYMQCGELVAASVSAHVQEGGTDFKGPSELSRLYRTADGYVRLHLESPEALHASGLGDDADASVESGLRAKLAGLTSAEAIGRVHSAGGVAVEARTYLDLARDEQLLAAQYLLPVEWPDGRTTFMPGRLCGFSRTQQDRTLTAPGVGEHTRAVLDSWHVEPAVVDRLIVDGVVREGQPIPSVEGVGYR